MPTKHLLFVYVAFYILKIAIYFANWNQPLTIKVLDVGQGDATLITTASRKHILIDGGPSYETDNYIFNATLFNCTLDVVVLTHPHKDHVMGLDRILDRCKVGTIFYDYIQYDSSDYKTFVEKAAQLNAKPLYAGQKFSIDGLDFYALWPTKDYVTNPPKNANLISIVLLMDYKDTEALFMGDAESSVIANFMEDPALAKIDGKLEIVKTAHHGSRNGLHKAFMRNLSPDLALISAGEGNSYGHPHQAVLDYFREAQVRVFRTDRDGTVSLNLKNLPK